MESTEDKQQLFITIIKYLVKRAQRNGYADEAFYSSLRNFKEKFINYAQN